MGPNFLLMEPPALNSAMSTPLKLHHGTRRQVERQLQPGILQRCVHLPFTCKVHYSHLFSVSSSMV